MIEWFEKRREERERRLERWLGRAGRALLLFAAIVVYLRLIDLDRRVAQLEHQVRLLDVGVMDHGDQIYRGPTP